MFRFLFQCGADYVKVQQTSPQGLFSLLHLHDEIEICFVRYGQHIVTLMQFLLAKRYQLQTSITIMHVLVDKRPFAFTVVWLH